MNRYLHASLSVLIVLTASRQINACTIIPPTPPPVNYTDLGLDPLTGLEKFVVAINLGKTGLFSPPTVTTCQCGTSFVNGVAIPHNVLDAYVTITDAITQMDVSRVANFDAAFSAPNGPVTALLETRAPTGNWTGFQGSIAPFTAPTLVGNQVFELKFDYEVPVSSIAAFLTTPLLVAGGSTDPGHVLTIEAVAPEPSTLSLLVGGGIVFGFLAKRRRRNL